MSDYSVSIDPMGNLVREYPETITDPWMASRMLLTRLQQGIIEAGYQNYQFPPSVLDWIWSMGSGHFMAGQEPEVSRLVRDINRTVTLNLLKNKVISDREVAVIRSSLSAFYDTEDDAKAVDRYADFTLQVPLVSLAMASVDVNEFSRNKIEEVSRMFLALSDQDYTHVPAHSALAQAFIASAPEYRADVLLAPKMLFKEDLAELVTVFGDRYGLLARAVHVMTQNALSGEQRTLDMKELLYVLADESSADTPAGLLIPMVFDFEDTKHSNRRKLSLEPSYHHVQKVRWVLPERLKSD